MFFVELITLNDVELWIPNYLSYIKQKRDDSGYYSDNIDWRNRLKSLNLVTT